MHHLLLLIAALLAVAGGVEADPTVSVLGRYHYNETARSASFDSPGAALSFGLAAKSNFTALQIVGVELSVLTSDNSSANQPHVFRVFLFAGDWATGVWAQRPGPLHRSIYNTSFNTSTWPTATPQTIWLYEGPLPAVFRFWLVKDTESDFNTRFFNPNYVTFYNFFFSPTAEQTAPKRYRLARDHHNGRVEGPTTYRRLEFLGDSITAGFCNLCNPPGEWESESFSHSWSYLAAEHFKALYHTTAWSGTGVVRNCCGGYTTAPMVFLRTAASTTEWMWDFARSNAAGGFHPDAIVINLGTNDGLNATNPGPLEHEWVKLYVSVLNNVTTAYTNNGRGTLHAFLAVGPMTNNYLPYVFEVMRRTKTVPGLKTHFLNFTMGLPSDHECCGHPNAQGDITLSGITIATISKVMGW